MKTAKQPASEAATGSNRRAQPMRQTRTNPPRVSALNRTNSLASGPEKEQQPIDIFPAITHFTDAITALPKELVRHFTLLKEVDAKIFAPEEALFQLIKAALDTSAPDPARSLNDASSSVAPVSAAISVQNSSNGVALNPHAAQAPSADESVHGSVFDPSNVPRRQLFRQTAWKIQEMLVSLEEKNHVISTANDALQKQLARIEEIWPHLENEFSEEAKWGSNTHWAYVENRDRPSKTSQAQAERSRRDGAAALAAAAQQLAEEAAARSSDRKQALAAKKNSKNQAPEADADPKVQETAKKAQVSNKSRKPAAETPAAAGAAAVGLGISANGPSSSAAPAKRRKTENPKTNGGAAMERAMSSVFGNNSLKQPKGTVSPRETPAPEGGTTTTTTTTKKRKALPTSSGQAKKSRTNAAAMSPSVTSSPLVGTFPDAGKAASPAPASAARPAPSRARQNSTQSNVDTSRQRPASAASNKPNGATVPPVVPDPVSQTNGAAQTTNDTKTSQKEATPVVNNKTIPTEIIKQENELQPPLPPPPPEPVSQVVPNGGGSNKREGSTTRASEARESTARELERESTTATTTAIHKRDSATPIAPPLHPTPTHVTAAISSTVATTKSGRASKPSTPALATFAEASNTSTSSATLTGTTTTTTTTTARSRPSRSGHSHNNAEGSTGSTPTTTTTTKRSHKKGATSVSASAAAANAAAAQQAAAAAAAAAASGDKENAKHKDGGAQVEEEEEEEEEDDADGDEPRYCYCNQVSYGEMVACDGDGCPREWFHLGCVGLKVAPKGNAKWFCDDCKKRLRVTEKKVNGR